MTKLPYSFFGAEDWDRDGHQDLVVRQDSCALGHCGVPLGPEVDVLPSRTRATPP